MAKKEDKRAYFKVDIGYLSNPKVAELMDENPRAVLLHLQCIAYSAQHLTDGIVPMRLAMRLACSMQSDLDACINAGLLRKVNATHIEVHDYLLHQRSAESVKGLSDQRKLAARARWEAEKADAPSNANRMQSAMQREEREEREELPCASAGAAVAEPDRFEEFWNVYGKKLDRKRAEQKWRMALRKRGVTADQIIEAARAYIDAQVTKGKHPEFTKHADAWLNGECWNDEIVPANVRQLRTDAQGQTVLPPPPGPSPWSQS